MNQYQQNLIRNVFENIPSKKILTIAQEVQKNLKKNENLIQKKEGGEIVTLADTKIQEIILTYFSNSLLAKTYIVKAEERIENEENGNTKLWQLLIDPLDGTNAFSKREKTWGVMVGACDREGILQYSWNFVSSNKVYKTEGTNKKILQNFKDKIANKKNLIIDVYAYGSKITDLFAEIFEDVFTISPGEYIRTSCPSSVWAGWEIYRGKVDALLWLPSNKGKKWYPDYDLIFLGALVKKGYKVRIGKIERKNSLIVVAPSDKDADSLYQVGYTLLTKEQKEKIIKAKNPLQITNAI